MSSSDSAKKTPAGSTVWLLQRSDVVGGTKIIIDELTRRLQARGLGANAVYLRGPQEHVKAGKSPVFNGLATVRDFARLARRFLRERPRLIVTFTPLLGALVSLFALPSKRTSVIATHHTPAFRIGGATRWLDRLSARLGAYDAIVACAPAVAASYASNGPRYMKSMSVIANGVASSDTPRTARRDSQLRRSVGLPPGTNVAFAAGRLASEKNHSLLLRAIALAPGWCLVLAGDGSARRELEREARELGITARVSFLGVVPRERVAAWFSECDVFVQPSLFEGLSLALLEAMARGAPVLASDIPGNRDALTSSNGTVGWLLPGSDPHAWADVLATVRDDPSGAEEVGARARDHQRREFDEEQMYQRYMRLICEHVGL